MANETQTINKTDVQGKGPLHFYELMSHFDLAQLPKATTAVFMPCSPLEEHGVHLPLGVDAILARELAIQTAQRLSQSLPDWHFVIFPTFFAGADVLEYRGSIEVKPSLIREYLLMCIKQLTKDGLQKIVLFGGHGGPRHMVVLEEVAAQVNWRFRPAKAVSATSRFLFDSLMGRLPLQIQEHLKSQGQPISDELMNALKTDYHAGAIETSLFLELFPKDVRSGYKSLKPAILSQATKIRKKSAKNVGEGLGHLGSPALADPTLGRALIEVVLAQLTPLLKDFLLDQPGAQKPFRSKLYYVPFFRSHFNQFLIMVGAILAIFGSLAYFTRLTLQFMEVMK